MRERRPDAAWARLAESLTFDTPYQELWQPGPEHGQWFTSGTLNLSVNCLDRHLEQRSDQVALYWEGEPGDRRSFTYAEVHEQVAALSRALLGMGVGLGDRVGIHLGFVPEALVALLACARIGAVHTVLPAPLPVEPLADRLEQLELKVLFTQDGAWRHGTVLPLKARADEALLAGGSVEHTIVVRRTGMDVAWFEGDRWYHDLVATTRRATTPAPGAPVSVPADHPLSMVTLANRGGYPVATFHGTAALLLTGMAVHQRLRSGPVFWCAGDLSWAVTQFHGIFAPLAAGDTIVAYEGTLDIPDHRRAWEIIGRYGVSTMLTVPAVMRTVRGWARQMPPLSSVPTLRRVATAGEAVEPELHEWLTQVFSGDHLEVADAWGQLQLGGIVRVTPEQPKVPGPQDSGAIANDVRENTTGDNSSDPPPSLPMPDCGLDIVDRLGQSVPDGQIGEVVLRAPWPASLVSVEGHHDGDLGSHWTRYPDCYATGDLALREVPQGTELTPAEAAHGDAPAQIEQVRSGTVVFLGRTDDVVSISGQLVSLREVRDVLLEHPFVEAADVTWRKDAELGRVIVAGVVLSAHAHERSPHPAPDGTGGPDLDAIAVELMNSVREVLGGLARPRAVLIVDRFGEELSHSQRCDGIASLATSDRQGPPRQVTWAQILAAAGQN